MPDKRHYAIDQLHNWLIKHGQGFRIESVGIAHQSCHLPEVDLSKSIYITIYEALFAPVTSEQLQFFKKSLDQSLHALYTRCACIRDLAYREGIVQEAEILPHITYSAYNNTVFAQWFIHKYNLDSKPKQQEILHHAV